MKGLEKRNISVLFALLLAGTILTSARANSTKLIEANSEEDMSYFEEVEEYVDEFIETYTSEDIEETPSIKIYDEAGELILEEEIDDNMSEEATKLIRQSEFLTEYENTTYYQLNS